MPTNKELEKRVNEQDDRLDKILGTVESIAEKIQTIDMEAQAHAPMRGFGQGEGFRPAPSDGGWVIRTPNQQFNGDTAGVRFIQGMAVISADTENAENTIKTLINEFGYSTQPVSESDLRTFHKYISDNLRSIMDGKDRTMEEKLASVQPMFGANVR